MPKNDGVNKTEEIKRYMAEHPEDGPKAVAEALTARGIPMSAGYVSTIKAAAKRGSKPAAGRMKKAVVTIELTMELLEHGLAVAERLGGVHQAKRIFDFLDSLAAATYCPRATT